MASKIARVINLFDALTGDSLGPQDAGEGLRQKAWLDEVPQWSLFAATEKGLKGSLIAARGRPVNFPAFLASEGGREFSSNPIGDPPTTSVYNGVAFSKAIQQTLSLGTGDNAVLLFGDTPLTEPDITSANYFNTTTDPDDAVIPVGGQAPAFLQTLVDSTPWDTSAAGDDVLTMIVNGETFVLTLPTATGNATFLAEELVSDLVALGVPVGTSVEGGDTARIFAPGVGRSSTIQVVTGGAGTVLFSGAAQSSQLDLQYRGTGGPLNESTNANQANGVKPQRRVLPGSVVVSATLTAVIVTMSDTNKDGVLVPSDGAHTGTIDYVTGAVNVTYVADAPDNATDVSASFKSLIPLDLEQPVRVPVGGMDLALEVL